MISEADPAIEVPSGRATAEAWLRRRGWALGVGAVLVGLGMSYSLLWAPVVRHASAWIMSLDVWATFRSAHLIGWGDIGDLYSSQNAFVTFPGITLVLAPVAMVSGALGLHESYPQSITHPTAWLLLGPAVLLLGAVVLVPLDSLAEELGVSRGRRALLSVAEGVVLFPVIVLWGHPEDALALAFAAWGLRAALTGRWRSSGWLWGIGVAFQPLVLLLIPLMLGIMPGHQRVRFLARAATPSLLLLAIPLLQEWHATTYTLLKQPNFPNIDHPTPLLFLAPVLTPGHWMHSVVLVNRGGTTRLAPAGTLVYVGKVVAAGPARVVSVLFACGIGVWAWRRHPTPSQIVWLAAAALALRCVFESVMDPYYVWPPLALILIGAAQRGGWRFAVAVASSVGVSVYAEHFFRPWIWWGPVVVMIAVGLACAWPGSAASAGAAVAVDGAGEDVTDRMGASRRLGAGQLPNG